ncbi:MAG: hypothetical protein HY314_08140 [Acidobacteria bacterium]|nr:hypothetical protein [Acidobacteriota bacterium]
MYTYDDSRVYGFFQMDTAVRPARLSFDVYNSDNLSVYHLEITENDISLP